MCTHPLRRRGLRSPVIHSHSLSSSPGSSAAGAVSAMDSLCPPGTSLLLQATSSRSAPLLQVGPGWVCIWLGCAAGRGLHCAQACIRASASSQPIPISCLPTRQALAEWGHQEGYRWSVAEAAGPTHVTPLHVAAAARSAPLFQALFGESRGCVCWCASAAAPLLLAAASLRWLLRRRGLASRLTVTPCLSLPPCAPGMDPEGARQGWHTAQTSDGLTPAAFAALVKARAAAGAGAPAAAAAAPALAAPVKAGAAEPQAAADGGLSARAHPGAPLPSPPRPCPSPVAVAAAALQLQGSNATTLEGLSSDSVALPTLRPPSPVPRAPSPHDSVCSPDAAARPTVCCCSPLAPRPQQLPSTATAAALSPPTPEVRASPVPASPSAEQAPAVGAEGASKSECHPIAVRCVAAPASDGGPESAEDSPTCHGDLPLSEASSCRPLHRTASNADSAMGDSGERAAGGMPARLGWAAILAMRSLLRLAAPRRGGS